MSLEFNFFGIDFIINSDLIFIPIVITFNCIIGIIIWIIYCSRSEICQFIKNRYEWLMWNLWLEWKMLLLFISCLIIFDIVKFTHLVVLEFLKIKFQ